MSKKKKLEAERKKVAMLEEQLRAERAKNNGGFGPGIVCAPMGNGVYPVAPPSNIIQLPPIVQPVVMVPFSSQTQPLATYIDDEDEDF